MEVVAASLGLSPGGRGSIPLGSTSLCYSFGWQAHNQSPPPDHPCVHARVILLQGALLRGFYLKLLLPYELRMKIVFFGSPLFAVPFLNTLITSEGIDVVGVVTQPDKPVGRKGELKASAIGAAAEA